MASEPAATSEIVLDLPPSYPGPHGQLRGSIVFVGNATTVIEHAGFTVLTDPNFLHAGDHAHLGYGLRSRRLKNPALEPNELPPLDACVLSHLHGDHWDRVAEAALPKTLRVTRCGRICLGKRKINLSRAFAGEIVGIREVEDQVWLVSFLDFDLGFFDRDEGRVEPTHNPFGPEKVSTMSPE